MTLKDVIDKIIYVIRKELHVLLCRTRMRKEKIELQKTSKSNKIIKICLISFMIIILIIGMVALAGYIYIKNKLGKINYVEIDTNTIEINEEIKKEKEEKKDKNDKVKYRTIALFGVDSRENKIEEGTRSDCIILAVIDENSKKISLISVYRDSYLQISGTGLDKVTHAYAYGGPKLSMSTLNTNLDLDITEFVTVNFKSLVDIIDSIGGITLDITNSEVKYINGYITETSKVTGKTAEQITKPGRYHLNGVQAVSYTRIRYTSGGDYKRAERMRTVLLAILNKAKGLSIGRLNKLADKLLPEIYTNIDSNEIMSMFPKLMKYYIAESRGWPYETKGKTMNNIWYGIPITLEENVKKLHEEVYHQTNYTVSNKVKEISNKIIEKTGYK